jgi:bifunctional DNA-binding transcriptional regulator/antitoxin component of YhaV-PrlF toxin-antitoxin module
MDAKKIYTQDYEYPIRSNDNSNRFRITVPKEMMDKLNIEDKEELSVRLILDDENRLIIVYSTEFSEEDYTIKSSKHSSGEVTIPNGIGKSLDLRNCVAEWKGKKYDTHSELCAITDKNLEMFNGETKIMTEKELRHVEQDVNFEGKKWDQEHFQLYLTVEQSEKLNWNENEEVNISLTRFGDKLSILLEPTNKPSENSKTAKTTGESQNDLFLYIPNDVVISMGFSEKELLWIKSESNKLVLVPI